MDCKGFVPVLLIGIIAFAIIIGVGAWFIITVQKNPHLNLNNPDQIACNQEARQCPDGNYVVHTGPKCEFAACPSSATSTSEISNSNLSPLSFSLKQLLYPVFTWSVATSSFIDSGAATPQSDIAIEAVVGKRYGTLTLTGQEWQSVVDSKTYATVASSFRKHYDDLYVNYMISIGQYNSNDRGSLTLGGYRFDPLEADGPFGGEWGYLFKSGSYEQGNPSNYTRDLIREITLSSHSANVDGSLCTNNPCPYESYTIFLSDPMTVGDILAKAFWQ